MRRPEPAVDPIAACRRTRVVVSGQQIESQRPVPTGFFGFVAKNRGCQAVERDRFVPGIAEFVVDRCGALVEIGCFVIASQLLVDGAGAVPGERFSGAIAEPAMQRGRAVIGG